MRFGVGDKVLCIGPSRYGFKEVQGKLGTVTSQHLTSNCSHLTSNCYFVRLDDPTIRPNHVTMDEHDVEGIFELCCQEALADEST